MGACCRRSVPRYQYIVGPKCNALGQAMESILNSLSLSPSLSFSSLRNQQTRFRRTRQKPPDKVADFIVLMVAPLPVPHTQPVCLLIKPLSGWEGNPRAHTHTGKEIRGDMF